jgi:hypothetical protein
MSESIKLLSVALDCPDAGELAAFYAGITGGTVIFRDDRWAVVQTPGCGPPCRALPLTLSARGMTVPRRRSRRRLAGPQSARDDLMPGEHASDLVHVAHT